MRDNSSESYELNSCTDPLPSTLELGKPPQKDMQQLGHLLAAKYARLRLKKKSLGNKTLLSALFDSKLKLGSLHKSRL